MPTFTNWIITPTVVVIMAMSGCTTTSNKAVTDQTNNSKYQRPLQSYAERPPQDDIVYFVLPDRFANGDRDNDKGGYEGSRTDHGFDPSDKGFYHGGDLKGLTQKLDYISELGASAIWLAPIFKNKPVQGKTGAEHAAYHGYWITDFLDVDPHFGTQQDFKEFVEQAHLHGMKVYMDIITNHTADVIKYRECHNPALPSTSWQVECPYRAKADYPFTTQGPPNGTHINPGFMGDEAHVQTEQNFALLNNYNFAYQPYVPKTELAIKHPNWLNDIRYYHNRGDTTFEGESSLYGDFAGLDDLMTEHPDVVAGMIEIYKEWVTRYKVDGFRIDTTRHVNPEFWRQFLPALKQHATELGIPNFYMFGEVYDFDPAALARFTRVDGFEQLLDFGLQSAIQQVVTEKTGTDRLARLLAADELYAQGQRTASRLPTFLGNHDMGRISGIIKNTMPGISQEELLNRTKIAHAFLLLLRGVPVIYSGDEQGFVSDDGDKLARENMFTSKVSEYNDNNLIGTEATTAQENYDRDHPLFKYIQQLSEIRKSHPTLRNSQLVPRYSDRTSPLFVFSRFDTETGHEYIIAINAGSSELTANIDIDYLSESFVTVLGNCPKTSSARGSLSVEIQAFSAIVCRANQASSRFERVQR